MPYYYAEVTHPWVQHSNKAFTSNKGFISKGILFLGHPVDQEQKRPKHTPLWDSTNHLLLRRFTITYSNVLSLDVYDDRHFHHRCLLINLLPGARVGYKLMDIKCPGSARYKH